MIKNEERTIYYIHPGDIITINGYDGELVADGYSLYDRNNFIVKNKNNIFGSIKIEDIIEITPPENLDIYFDAIKISDNMIVTNIHDGREGVVSNLSESKDVFDVIAIDGLHRNQNSSNWKIQIKVIL